MTSKARELSRMPEVIDTDENGDIVISGNSGGAVSYSTDPNNIAQAGTDGKVFAQMAWTGTPNW